MITLYKNVHLFEPEDKGIQDILVTDQRICAIGPHIDLGMGSEYLTIVDCKGLLAFPGFIDSHVHVLGGGGEGGYATRTPEIKLTDITTAGVTSLVGCLGTDGQTRHMSSLIAKVKGLRQEGISAYAYTGSYRVPVKTLTDSIQSDLLMIEEIIGVGEIALSDHRSSNPTQDEFMRLVSDARVGGILSGKAGIVNIHLGDGKDELHYLNQLSESDIPVSQVLPTHCNRNKSLFIESVGFAKNGGVIDFTTSQAENSVEDKGYSAYEAVERAHAMDVPITNMTLSSDGQGSLPKFDKEGHFLGLGVGKSASLYETVRRLIQSDILPIEDAIKLITENPARILKLAHKGRLAAGYDADIVFVESETYKIHTVVAKGQTMVRHGNALIKGLFE